MSRAGGANGIGKEVAVTFSKHGQVVLVRLLRLRSIPKILPCSAKVVIGDLDVAGAEAVVSSITTNGGSILFDYLCSRSP